MTLDQVPPGQSATILGLEGDPALVQRLLEFGLFEGEQVTVLTLAPLGDPLELAHGSTRLSLRKREAAAIQVSPAPAS